MVPLYRHIPILLLTAAACVWPVLAPGSLPSADEQPSFKQRLSRDGGNTALPARRVIFGIGVGFERAGAARGVALSQVLAGSPAERAGLSPGTVVAEINGASTIGRTEEECVRMVRESGPSVKLKFYDPATLLPHTIVVTKETIPLPN